MRLGLVLLLLPSLAFADSVLAVVATAQPSVSTYTYNSGCDTALSVEWLFTSSLAVGVGSLCGSLTLWATSGECGDVADTANGDVPFDAASVTAATMVSTQSAAFTITPSALPSFTSTTLADGGVSTASTCGAAGITVTNKLCASVQTSVTACGFSTATYLHAVPLTLVYDAVPPVAPTVSDTQPEESAARLDFSASSDSATVYAQYRESGSTAAWNTTDAVIATVGFVDIPNLVNGTSYDVQLFATDAAGNVSPASDLVTVIPVHTVGFFGTVRADGGTEEGGCSTAGGAWPLVALLLVGWLRSRPAP